MTDTAQACGNCMRVITTGEAIVACISIGLIAAALVAAFLVFTGRWHL